MLELPSVQVITVLVIAINVLIYRHRARKLSAEHPEMEPGYSKIVTTIAGWAVPLAIAIAVGAQLGWSRMFATFDGKPTRYDFGIAVAFFAIIARSLFFVFNEGGAEFLAEHRLLLGPNFPRTAAGWRLFWGFLSVGIIIIWAYRLFR